jgi:hypothetical protein
MTCPSIAGWIVIVAIASNVLGILILWKFPLLTAGGLVDDPYLAKVSAQNRSRMPLRYLGKGLIGMSLLLGVVAAFFH